SVVNSLYARKALAKSLPDKTPLEIYETLSSAASHELRQKVLTLARKNGMIYIDDDSGTNIDVQIFDMARLTGHACWYEPPADIPDDQKPVIFVMDYAFGEQAYETIDELLKPFFMEGKEEPYLLDVASISIMGKAGILDG